MRKFQIENGILTSIRQETPRRQPGERIMPRAIVMHYTAGASFPADLTSMKSVNSPGLAHLLIGPVPNFMTAQLRSLEMEAPHAGPSSLQLPDGQQWIGFNRFSVGIELSNPGFLKRVNGSADWVTWFGTTIRQGPDVLVRRHPKDKTLQDLGWVRYTREQLIAAAEIARSIASHYGITVVVGHEDITAGKLDPGPAFPMREFRQYVLGESDTFDPENLS